MVSVGKSLGDYKLVEACIDQSMGMLAIQNYRNYDMPTLRRDEVDPTRPGHSR